MPRVLILGGARTPFVKAGTDFAELDVLELARAATAEALARTEIDPGQVDEVIFGNVARPVAYHNLAREIVLSLSMPTRIPAFTVGLACASACVAITSAADHIAGGNADVVVAGGSESLTNVPLTLPPRLAPSPTGSTPEKLASLRPVFDREHGTITAGNASPLTDGAAAVVLAGEARARALGLEPLAAVRSYAYAAVDPADQLLIAPAYAVPIALQRAGLTLDDIHLFEMHEAFAAQVLSTLAVLEQNGIGRVPVEKLNVMGGSIALGHPFGAPGAPIVLTPPNQMRRRGPRHGPPTARAAGGTRPALTLRHAGWPR